MRVTDEMVEAAIREWMRHTGVEAVPFTMRPTLVAALAAAPQSEADHALGYATGLATSLWKKHYKGAAPQWEPFDSLMGVLTQIDNMASGLAPPLAAAPQAEPVAWAQKAALDGVREYGEIIATLYADGYQPEQEWTEPLYAAPPQRKPQAEQEPVAYIHRQGRHWEVSERPLAHDEKARGWTEEPLYTVPPAPDALREAARMALREMERAAPLLELYPDDYGEAILALREALGDER